MSLARAIIRAVFLIAVAFLFGPAIRAQQPQEPAADPLGGPFDVWSVALSQDGKVLAAGAGWWDRHGEIGVWDFATRQPRRRYGEELGVASVAFSPNGTLLASGSWSGQVRVRDWAADKEVAVFDTDGVARVALSPDGALLATATETKAVQLWELTQRKLAADLQGDLFRFHCVTFSPDGQRVLAGGGDWKRGGVNQVTIWDVPSRKQVLKLVGHENAVLCIAFSRDGKTIATAGIDNTVRLWEADRGKLLQTLRGHTHWVESVLFSADGKTLVSGSQDRTIRFWDIEQGKETDRIDMPGRVKALCFTPDGATLIAGGGPKTLKLFDATTHKEAGVFWNGADLQPMDTWPTGPQQKIAGRNWIVPILLGLLVPLLLAAPFVVWIYRRERRRAEMTPAGPDREVISFPCPSCGKRLKANAELAGRKVKCSECGQVLPVPETVADSTSPPTPGGRRLPRVVVALLLVAGLGAGLVIVVLGLSGPGKNAAVSSRLQEAADKVRALATESIDASSLPLVADKDLSVLHDLPILKQLNLDNTEITDGGLKELVGVPSLVSLSLSGTQVSDAGLAELKPLRNLAELRLDKSSVTDSGLVHLKDLPRLRKLSLYQTQITDAGLVHLKEMSSLQHLSFDETQVGDDGLNELLGLSRLQYLSVWNTRVSEAGVRAWSEKRPGVKVNR